MEQLTACCQANPNDVGGNFRTFPKISDQYLCNHTLHCLYLKKGWLSRGRFHETHRKLMINRSSDNVSQLCKANRTYNELSIVSQDTINRGAS